MSQQVQVLAAPREKSRGMHKVTWTVDGNDLTLVDTGSNDISILSEYADCTKDLCKDITHLAELINQTSDLVLEQGEDVLKLEENIENSEALTEQSVISLAGAAREQLKARTKKYILWGAGIGAIVGGVTGVSICVVVAPDPTTAMIAGGCGVLAGAGIGAIAGGAIGTARQNWDSKVLDNTMICYSNKIQMRRENWVDPDTVGQCMKCQKRLGKLWLRAKYTCMMCGEVCCWDCCNHSVVVKYSDVKAPQLERICAACCKSTQQQKPKKKSKKTFYI